MSRGDLDVAAVPAGIELGVVSAELCADHPDLMGTGDPIPTPDEIHEDDVALLDEGRDASLITVLRGRRFNTLDRPTPAGQ